MMSTGLDPGLPMLSPDAPRSLPEHSRGLTAPTPPSHHFDSLCAVSPPPAHTHTPSVQSHPPTPHAFTYAVQSHPPPPCPAPHTHPYGLPAAIRPGLMPPLVLPCTACLQLYALSGSEFKNPTLATIHAPMAALPVQYPRQRFLQVNTHTHECAHAHACIYTHACTYTHTCTHMNAHTHTHTHARTHVRMHVGFRGSPQASGSRF